MYRTHAVSRVAVWTMISCVWFVVSLAEKEQVRWFGRNAMFLGTNISASFPDGSQLEFHTNPTTETATIVENATAIGQALSFFFHDESRQSQPLSSKEVRLYMIQPKDDWQLDETYEWKLAQSWMLPDKAADAAPPLEAEWLFWNVEAFINSDIKVPESISSSKPFLFECNYLEFNYIPRAKHSTNARRKTKFVAHNVKIGAYLPDNYEASKLPTYNPCDEGTQCSAIDGAVTCGPTKAKRFILGRNVLLPTVVVGSIIIALGVFLLLDGRWIGAKAEIGTQKYASVQVASSQKENEASTFEMVQSATKTSDCDL